MTDFINVVIDPDVLPTLSPDIVTMFGIGGKLMNSLCHLWELFWKYETTPPLKSDKVLVSILRNDRVLEKWKNFVKFLKNIPSTEDEYDTFFESVTEILRLFADGLIFHNDFLKNIDKNYFYKNVGVIEREIFRASYPPLRRKTFFDVTKFELSEKKKNMMDSHSFFLSKTMPPINDLIASKGKTIITWNIDDLNGIIDSFKSFIVAENEFYELYKKALSIEKENTFFHVEIKVINELQSPTVETLDNVVDLVESDSDNDEHRHNDKKSRVC